MDSNGKKKNLTWAGMLDRFAQPLCQRGGVGSEPSLRYYSFENLNLYLMKTAKISVYGNIAVYRNIAMSVYNCFRLDTIMLRIHVFSIFTIKTP